MAKVEILSCNDPVKLENKINDFIKDKKVIDIKYQSIAVPETIENNIYTGFAFYDRVLILYEEKKGVYR